MRFGMFIHWGPVTLRGTGIGWSRGENVKVEDYDNLYRELTRYCSMLQTGLRLRKMRG